LRRIRMLIKRKSPAESKLLTEDLAKRLRSFDRIISLSSTSFRLADEEVETLKITGVHGRRK